MHQNSGHHHHASQRRRVTYQSSYAPPHVSCRTLTLPPFPCPVKDFRGNEEHFARRNERCRSRWSEKARKFARRSDSAGSGCCRRMAAVPCSDFALRNCEAVGTIERCRTFDDAASSEANPERHRRADVRCRDGGLRKWKSYSGRLNTNIAPWPVPTTYCLPSTA